MKTHEYLALCSAGLILFLLTSQTLEELCLCSFLGLNIILIADGLFAKEKINLQDWIQSTRRFWNRFKADQSAVTAIEYALIAAFIVLIIFAGVKLLGKNTSGTFNTISTSV